MARAYLVNSMLTPSTKGTYRWIFSSTFSIDALGDLSFTGSKAPKPYSMDERAELISIARSQNKAWRRSSALAMIALSIGAGCRAHELNNVKGRDLTTDGSHLVVDNRAVRVKYPWNEVLASLKQEEDKFLFHPNAPGRDTKNFICGFASDLTKDPASPRFQIARARSSFICDRWNEALPLRELLETTGIRQVESLMRYVHLLDGAPGTKAGLRHMLAKGNP